MLAAVCHSEETGWIEVKDLATISDLHAKAGNLLWAEADVASLTEEDVATIAEEFDLHPLAVEDVTTLRQRPKIERYESHLFAVFHELYEENEQVEARQIACFIGDRYVLTLHAGASRTTREAKERMKQVRVEKAHPSFLLHSLLDACVDDYQALADRLENEMETLEDIVLSTPRAPVQRQLYSLKQRVARLRRYVLPGARLLDWATSTDSEKPFTDETAMLFRDVHDHLLRISDQVKNVDELSQAALELTRSEQSNALNEVSRKLAGWAAIFGVDTIIAGIYGMNYDLLPAADGTNAPFAIALGMMVVCTVALYLNFKRRGWM